jgi:hypothetical protein
METLIDVTDHSDRELSLIVFNDEYLYSLRRRSNFIDILRDMFTATDEQWQDLEESLKEDEESNA